MAQPSEQAREQIDFRRALGALKGAALPIALATIAAGAVTYGVSRAQPPVYEATTAIISAGNQTGNQTVNSTLVSAPPLPPGALEEALVSAAVIGRVRDSVDAIPEATEAERARIRTDLGREAAARRVRTFALRGRLDLSGNGVYRLSARASRPGVAVALTNLAANAMIEWDVQRALDRVRTAREALTAQLADTNARLARRGSAADERSLAELRAEQVDQLNSITSLERAVSGTLRVVAPAVAPEEPILPRPARNAALAAALGLLAAAGLVLLRASLDRTVSTDADLKPFNLGALGEIPRLRTGPKGASVLPLLQSGDAAEAIGFLRANLDALLPKGQPKIVLVTSGAPAEGKSSLTAALGHAFATAGQKTLIIDADIRRPRQTSVWSAATRAADWAALPGAAPRPGGEARDLRAALREPGAAQALRLEEGLHLLPAGAASGDTAGLFTGPAFGAILKGWAAGYEVILIDSPPTLAVADPVLIAPHTSGVLVVLEAGRTSQAAVQRMVENFSMAGARVLGVALNKVDPRAQEVYYGYGYGYDYQALGKGKNR